MSRPAHSFHFPTKFEPHDRVHCSAGSRLKTLYHAEYVDGSLELIEDGIDNIYDDIQSYAQSCDLKYLMARYENGEVDVLNRVEGFYGDISGLPSSYAEIVNKVRSAEDFFMTLPVDVREAFGFDFNKFISEIDHPDFLDKMLRKPVENFSDSDLNQENFVEE